MKLPYISKTIKKTDCQLALNFETGPIELPQIYVYTLKML